MHYAHFQYFDYLIIRYFDVFAWVSIVIKVLCNNLRIRGILLIEKTVIFTLLKKNVLWKYETLMKYVIQKIFG